MTNPYEMRVKKRLFFNLTMRGKEVKKIKKYATLYLKKRHSLVKIVYFSTPPPHTSLKWAIFIFRYYQACSVSNDSYLNNLYKIKDKNSFFSMFQNISN